MNAWLKSSLSLKRDSSSCAEFKSCLYDLTQHEMVRSMEHFIQHGNITCLEHSIYVSYISFLMCRKLKLDYRSAARGALLHDFFLYDWHVTKPIEGLHGFTHPYAALENADRHFQLNDLERDIIMKHMWPLTIKLPKYKESFIVTLADKYCASMELMKSGRKAHLSRLMREVLE